MEANTNTNKTLKQFVADNGITMSSKRVNSNSLMGNDMDHWSVTLKYGGNRMTLRFSKGFGHNGAQPEISEVLDCLASDSASVENASGFDDWAADFGYDADSRKAERIYRACQKQSDKLKALLGDGLYSDLLWNTERE